MQKHRIEIDGQRFEYLQSGAGPPLLLIHGLLGGSFCWRFNIPAFSQQYTTMALDLSGFGENGSLRNHSLCNHGDDRESCGMQAQAARLAALLRKLELESVDIVGSSWGGAVAIFLAAQSRRVRSLVLAAPVNPWSGFGAGRIRFFNRPIGRTLLRMLMPVSHPLHKTALRRMYGDPARISAGTLEGYSALLMRRGRARGILNTLRPWENDLAALHAAVSRVQARSLLIWGTRDGAVDLKSSETLMRMLPECELAMIQGAGHLPFEETPDEFNRLTLEFLARTSVGQRARKAL
ncbi:MAG TPA: alpha/beta fold hydrolase [Candidatus Angelobacter sp.]|nr:alpha/beta fold hydrolase [Candidatus Angelobacter sp.]